MLFIVDHLSNFDRSVASLIARIPKSYEMLMASISKAGSFWLVTLVIPILFVTALVFSDRDLMVSLAITVVLAPLAELAKLITRRRRPKSLYVERMRFKTYSFPSGHSYISALICGYLITLAFIYIGGPLSLLTAALLAVFAISVGVSRVYLDAHFPSDVVAGWLLALLVLYFSTTIRNL